MKDIKQFQRQAPPDQEIIEAHIWRSDEGKLLDSDVSVCRDGRRYDVRAGSEIVLAPGESLSL